MNLDKKELGFWTVIVTSLLIIAYLAFFAGDDSVRARSTNESISPNQTLRECITPWDCGDKETCDYHTYQFGECRSLPAPECGYVEGHKIYTYECCKDADCPQPYPGVSPVRYVCQNHLCVQYAGTLPCNYNGFCEPELGETEHLCPSDCACDCEDNETCVAGECIPIPARLGPYMPSAPGSGYTCTTGEKACSVTKTAHIYKYKARECVEGHWVIMEKCDYMCEEGQCIARPLHEELWFWGIIIVGGILITLFLFYLRRGTVSIKRA